MICSGGQAQPLALELLRTDDVDTVGLAVDVIVDPGQFVLEVFGTVRRRPEHTEAAGVGHRGDDVTAMAESQQGEFDAEQVADRSFHLNARFTRFIITDGHPSDNCIA